LLFNSNVLTNVSEHGKELSIEHTQGGKVFHIRKLLKIHLSIRLIIKS